VRVVIVTLSGDGDVDGCAWALTAAFREATAKTSRKASRSIGLVLYITTEICSNVNRRNRLREVGGNEGSLRTSDCVDKDGGAGYFDAPSFDCRASSFCSPRL